MNEQVKTVLVEAAQRDMGVRKQLADHGQLHAGPNGFHPVMEGVHMENALLLERVIDEIGWPGREKVGDEGAAAAIYIIQNSVAKPMLQRRALKLMLENIPKGQASAIDTAYLADRIAVFEGRPQIYGTQFDWDDKGQLSPAKLDDPKKVDERRKQLGMPNMAETTKRMRDGAAKAGEKAPADLKQRRAEFDAWAKSVGWRA